jgi:hypothetical protein
MKKNIISLLLFVVMIFGIATTNYSQDAQSSITMSGQVLSTIFVNTVQNIDIGDMTAGQTYRIEPDAPQAGQFNITSDNNNTRFSFSVQTTPFTHSVTGTELAYTLIMKGSDTLDNTTNLFDITPNTMYNSGPASAPPFGQRLRSIFVGVEVEVPQEQEGGVYSSIITLSVDIL